MVFLWQYAERKMLIRCSEIWVFVIQISQTNGTELQILFNNNQITARVNLPLFVSGSHSNYPSLVRFTLFPGPGKEYQSFSMIPMAAAK